jgi:hypothetical protein
LNGEDLNPVSMDVQARGRAIVNPILLDSCVQNRKPGESIRYTKDNSGDISLMRKDGEA